MAHGIVRTDNMHGTAFGGDLVSILYQESATNTDIDNGNFCVAGAFVTGERNVRIGGPADKSDALSTLVLIASEEVLTDKNTSDLSQFYNKAGTICRGYKLNAGDEFSLTADCFTTELTSPSVGAVLECAASDNKKAVLVASATASTTTIAKLIAKETDNGVTWYVFRV